MARLTIETKLRRGERLSETLPQRCVSFSFRNRGNCAILINGGNQILPGDSFGFAVSRPCDYVEGQYEFSYDATEPLEGGATQVAMVLAVNYAIEIN